MDQVTTFISAFFMLVASCIYLLHMQKKNVDQLKVIIKDLENHIKEQDEVMDKLEEEADDWFAVYLRSMVQTKR
jgi:cell division protein FtsL